MYITTVIAINVILAAVLVSFFITDVMRNQHSTIRADEYTIDFLLLTPYYLLLIDAFARRGTSCSESCPIVACSTACFSSNTVTLLKQFKLISRVRVHATLLK